MNSGETRGSGAYLSWTFHLPDSLKDLVQAEIREGMIPLQGRVIYEFPKYTDTGSVVTINAAISYEGPLPDSDFYGLILHNHAHVECTLRGQNSPGLWAPLVRQRYFDWHDIGCD